MQGLPLPLINREQFKQRREACRLSQDEAAMVLGVTRHAIGRMERGDAALTARMSVTAAIIFAFVELHCSADRSPETAPVRGRPARMPPAHKSLFFNLNLEPVAWEAIRDAAPGTRYWAEKVPRGALERGPRLLYTRGTGVTGDDPAAGASLAVPALPIPTAAQPSTYVLADLSSFPIERHAELRAMQHADMVALERSINPDGPEPVPVPASAPVPTKAPMHRWANAARQPLRNDPVTDLDPGTTYWECVVHPDGSNGPWRQKIRGRTWEHTNDEYV